jgi:hypothetical protein
VSWKKKWIRTVAWCLELDGRRDKDECAKPIVGCGTGPAVGPVAVFSLVRFQEKEMRKAARRKYAEKVWQGGHFDIWSPQTFPHPSRDPAPQLAGKSLPRRLWQNVEMKEVAPQMS